MPHKQGLLRSDCRVGTDEVAGRKGPSAGVPGNDAREMTELPQELSLTLLTSRELEVLRHLAADSGNADLEVAAQLG